MREPPAIKKLDATGSLRALMSAYFQELDEAARTRLARVAWCTSVGPVELLRALGFRVYFPENHGALLGATRLAQEYIPAANAVGYAPSICSYLTSDVGAWLSGTTPLTTAYGLAAVPRPDVLVYNTNQCRDVQEWFGFYSRELKVPALGIATPRSLGEITKAHIDGFVGQYRALVPHLEAVAGVKLDLDRLREVTAASHRCSRLWERVLRTATRQPSPLTFFDGTIHMGPAVVLRGDPRAEAYYQLLATELEARVAAQDGAVDGERWRLYWDGMPVWGQLRTHAAICAAQQACVVASTYCNSWIFEALAEADPWVGMARAYTELFIVRSEEYKEQYLARMASDYAIDAFVFHDAMTCPSNSNNRYGLPARLTQRTGIPHVVIHGDLNNLRLYSHEQTRTQLEALVEQLRESQLTVDG